MAWKRWLVVGGFSILSAMTAIVSAALVWVYQGRLVGGVEWGHGPRGHQLRPFHDEMALEISVYAAALVPLWIFAWWRLFLKTDMERRPYSGAFRSLSILAGVLVFGGILAVWLMSASSL